MPRFQMERLSNGLTVVGEYLPEAASMAAGYFVRTGARDEPEALQGVSHFLEHMVFKGTARRSAWDVNREFDEMGAEYNAFTGWEYTVFYGAVLPEYQDRLLDLLTDLMRPALREEDFQVEKKVILEEIALYRDRPRFRVFDEVLRAFYAGHPLGHSILGTEATIGPLTRDQMAAYHAARYRPGNMILVLTGRYDWARALEQVAELTAPWPAGDAERRYDPPRPWAGRRRLPDGDRFTQAHIAFALPGIPNQGPREAAELLADVVGGGRGSRFYWRLIHPGKVEAAYFEAFPQDRAGCFVGYVACAPEQAEAVLEEVGRILEEVRREGVRPEELARMARKRASGEVLEGETPYGRLLRVGFEILYRERYRSLDEQTDAYLQTRPEELGELAELLDWGRAAVVWLGPEA